MKDFILDENGDIAFKNGHLVIGDSDIQNQKLILSSHKGDFKEWPEIGVGIDQMMEDDEIDHWLIEAKKNLEYDGMKVRNISFTEDGKLNVDANYKTNE